MEFEIKTTFTLVPPKVKYSGVNPAKYLYEENDKTLMNKFKELTTQRDNPCSWIEKLNVMKMSVLPLYLQTLCCLHACQFDLLPTTECTRTTPFFLFL